MFDSISVYCGVRYFFSLFKFPIFFSSKIVFESDFKRNGAMPICSGTKYSFPDQDEQAQQVLWRNRLLRILIFPVRYFANANFRSTPQLLG